MGRQRKENDSRLMIVVFVLAVVCLLAGGLYIDTFYGGGRLKTFMTQISKKDAEDKRAARPRESMQIDSGNKTDRKSVV